MDVRVVHGRFYLVCNGRLGKRPEFSTEGNHTHSGILPTAPPQRGSPTGYVGRVRGGGRVQFAREGGGGGQRQPAQEATKLFLRKMLLG